MENKIKHLIFLIIFLFSTSVLTQNPEWINYTKENSDLPGSGAFSCLAVDKLGNKWIGPQKLYSTYMGFWIVGDGLVKFNDTNWTVYDTSNSDLPGNYVSCVALDDEGNKWIGANAYGKGGLAKFDDENWIIYNTSNSGLPVNFVSSIVIDDNGSKWIGTNEGLAKFDDINWTVYDTSNSALPGNHVTSIAIDHDGNKWIGTDEGDIIKLDYFMPKTMRPNRFLNGTVYDTSNSDLSGNGITCITIDNDGNKWIGTNGELVIFDDTNWTVYDTSNSALLEYGVSSIAIDDAGDKWIGAGMIMNPGSRREGKNYLGGVRWFPVGSGLVHFDDINWTVYNTSNSELLDDFVFNIVVDDLGNKWVGTLSGLSVFNEGGIVPQLENTIPNYYLLYQNYPNPFNPKTIINYQLAMNSDVDLSIYSLLGQKVANLVSKKQAAGTYRAEWDASGFASGVYLYRLKTDNGFVKTKKLILLK